MGTRITAAAALPGLLLAFCCAATAAEPASSEAAHASYGGIKVGYDPATGRIRPLSEAESAALDKAVMASPAGVAARAGAARASATSRVAGTPGARYAIKGGGFAMKLPLSEMSHTIAVRDASGKLTVQHGDDGAILTDAIAPAVEELK